MEPRLLLAALLDKDVVGDGVPSVVNSDEEKQKRRHRNGEQRPDKIGAGSAGRCGQGGISGEGQREVKQPVLKLGGVCILQPHTASDDELVNNPHQPHQAPYDLGSSGPAPGSAKDCRQQQHGSEMNDGGSGEGAARAFHVALDGNLGDESDHDKLQADQGSGRRPNNNVKVFPSGEWCHVITVLAKLMSGTGVYLLSPPTGERKAGSSLRSE